MLEVAETVAEHFPGTKVVPAATKDDVQRDAKNEPDPFIMRYWQPQIDLGQGISDIVQQMAQ